MGSKARHGKEMMAVIRFLLDLYGLNSTCWVEPFVGGANMMVHATMFPERIANDSNAHVISMFNAVQNGWEPPDSVSEEEYRALAKAPALPGDPLVGFVGVGCSFAGKWFGGYARGNDSKGVPRNYCAESKRNILKQKPHIVGVRFGSGDYRQTSIPPGSVIYCDPPYHETTKYKAAFDTQAFWRWCGGLATKGHPVFVSEYEAPEHWTCVWSKKVFNSLTQDTGAKEGVEKLFTLGLDGPSNLS